MLKWASQALRVARYPRPQSRLYATVVEPAGGFRNIGIIAHIDAGKTTTTERLLYYAGVTNHLGNVDSGDTMTDFLPAERARGITIQSAAISMEWQHAGINLIDTPGHADFTFEVIRSLRVLDGAITILDAVAGVESQTEKVWQQAKDLNIPNLIYVNKMDRPGAGFSRTVKEVVSKLKTPIVMLTIPHFIVRDGVPVFNGVYDVLERKLLIWPEGGDGRNAVVTDASDNESVNSARAALIDTLSEIDESVVEAFLEAEGEQEAVSSSFLRKAIRRATIKCQVTPVLCGASFRNIGVQPLLDAVVSYLPKPSEKAITLAESDGMLTESAGELADDKLVRALAFKVVHDVSRGLLVYVRLYSGVLQKGSVLFNTTTGEQEKVTTLLQMQADRQINIDALPVGAIGVIVGSKTIKTGDTLVALPGRGDLTGSLTDAQKATKLLPIAVPSPVFVVRVSPKTAKDQGPMTKALDVLLREDPSLQASFDDDAGQWLLSGMGELHLEIARDRLIQDLKANVEVGNIMITFREQLKEATPDISKTVLNDNGEVAVTIRAQPRAPNERLASRFSVLLSDNNEVAVSAQGTRKCRPREITELAVVGIKPVIARGGKVARMALQNVRFSLAIAVNPISKHPAPLIAPLVREVAAEALAALQENQYSLLEPVVGTRITVPTPDAGVVIHDLSTGRRALIDGMTSGENELMADDHFARAARTMYTPVDHTMHLSKHTQDLLPTTTIDARVPLRFMVGYLTHLRSLTKGRGTFLIRSTKFDPVPAQDVESVLESQF